jgi:hypothetical protein
MAEKGQECLSMENERNDGIDWGIIGFFRFWGRNFSALVEGGNGTQAVQQPTP